MAPQKKYYTVGVSNKFAAFGEFDGSDASSDNEVILAAPPDTVETPPSAQNAGIAKKKESSGTPQKGGAYERRPHRASRGGGHSYWYDGDRATRGGRGGRFVRDGDHVSNSLEDEEQRILEEGGHRRRGAFRGRGRRGGREFHDRQPGFGRGKDHNKVNQAAQNWGTDEQGIIQEQKDMEVREEAQPQKEASEEKENVEKEAAVEEAEPEPELMDFDSYKRQMEERRANLPTFTSGKGTKKITTDKDLEAEGYVKHMKDGANTQTTEGVEEDAEVERDDSRKKKAINVFEYIHHEGGRVNLFPSRRGRGRGRGGRGGNDEYYRNRRGRGRGGVRGRSRDAPDILDQRAFPTLGSH